MSRILRSRRPQRPSAGRLSRCDGFSLAEALTAIAITGIVAAVVMSRTFGPRESGEIVAVVQTIQGISEAVTAYRGTVGRYPGDLRDLVDQPENATDLCGRSMPPHFLEEWRGPYLLRRVEDEGIPVGDGLVSHQIRREPATTADSSLGTLLIDVEGVREEVATRVNLAFDDDDDDLAAGTIRWAADEGETQIGKLTFAMPVRGC